MLLSHNANPPATSHVPTISSSFVAAGSETKQPKRTRPQRSLLGTAADWKFLFDLRHKPYLFPPHIYATDQRPDLLLYSNTARVVIFGELTCPAEEGIEGAKLRKQARYAPTAEAIRGLTHPWTVHVLILEVGARGFVARSTYNFLRKIGFTPRSANLTCRLVSEVTARCSYAIYLRHSEKEWNSSRTLLVPQSCKEPITEVDPSLRDQPLPGTKTRELKPLEKVTTKNKIPSNLSKRNQARKTTAGVCLLHPNPRPPQHVQCPTRRIREPDLRVAEVRTGTRRPTPWHAPLPAISEGEDEDMEDLDRLCKPYGLDFLKMLESDKLLDTHFFLCNPSFICSDAGLVDRFNEL